MGFSRRVLIAPSLLAADFSRLGTELERVQRAGADMIHLDVMDGHFVPNLTIGPPVVAALRAVSTLHFDVHLMLTDPGAFVEPFVKAGANGVTIHIEACPDPREILERIGRLGCKRGLTLNPDTPVDRIGPFLDQVDRLLIMSVFPGFGGQKFIPGSLERIARARELIGERAIELQVDGGVTVENAPAVREAGANNLVAGTSCFRAPDLAAAVAALRGEG